MLINPDEFVIFHLLLRRALNLLFAVERKIILSHRNLAAPVYVKIRLIKEIVAIKELKLVKCRVEYNYIKNVIANICTPH